MATAKRDETEYNALREAVKAGRPEKLYIFHGEERYLLEHYLGLLRKMVDDGGFGSFNHRRFDGKSLRLDDLEDAVDTLPAFAERTLIEVHDYNLFKADEASRTRLCELFEGLPDYVCLVFLYDTVEFAPDRRLKTTVRMLKCAHVVDFAIRDQSELSKWVRAHYKALGKRIAPEDAEYLAFITGGAMTAMLGEIEKTAAYARGEQVTRRDIDAVVTPVLDAVSYKLSDAVAAGDTGEAARLLDELLHMREPPHKLIFSISLKLRQLYAARLCLDAGKSAEELMELSGIRYGFQARNLMSAARGISAEKARLAVASCADAALQMNSGADPAEALTGLLVALAAEEAK